MFTGESGPTPHCGVPPDKLDPGWNKSKQREFYEKLDSEIKIRQGTPKFFDYGIEALLLDLNDAGYATRSSNMACSGSDSEPGPNVMFDVDRPDLVQEFDPDLPEGWTVQHEYQNWLRIWNPSIDKEQYKNDRDEMCEDLEGENFTACLQKFKENVDLVNDYNFPTREERIEVDRQLFKEVRRVTNTDD